MTYENRIKALKLRCDGHSIRQIAEELDTSVSSAQSAVQTHIFEMDGLLNMLNAVQDLNTGLINNSKMVLLIYIHEINGFMSKLDYQKINFEYLRKRWDLANEIIKYVEWLEETYNLDSPKLKKGLSEYTFALRADIMDNSSGLTSIYPDKLKKLEMINTEEVLEWEIN